MAHIPAHAGQFLTFKPHNDCVHPCLDSGGTDQRVPFTSPWGLNSLQSSGAGGCTAVPLLPADALAYEELLMGADADKVLPRGLCKRSRYKSSRCKANHGIQPVFNLLVRLKRFWLDRYWRSFPVKFNQQLKLCMPHMLFFIEEWLTNLNLLLGGFYLSLDSFA